MALMRTSPEPSEEAGMDWYMPTERLALTEDDRVVPEEHVEARWLYAIPGRRIPMAEAIRYGLVEPAPDLQFGPPPDPEPEPELEPELEPEPDEPADPAPDVFTPVVESEPVKRPRGRPRKAT